MTTGSVNFDYLLKYIIIGDAAVGKSNLLLRYAHGQFKPEYQLTIGVEFGAKNVEIRNKLYRIQIWDTAGQENFRSITRAYYKNSVCAMVVYDITSLDSFHHVQNWIEDIRNQSPKTVLIILIGNKIDLEEKRVVSYDEGSEFAIRNGIIFAETSAKTGDGIEEIFLKSAKEIAKNMSENYYDLTSETCGIKKGNVRKSSSKNVKDVVSSSSGSGGGNIELKSGKTKEEKEGRKCC
jgi:small GTP-binding protein